MLNDLRVASVDIDQPSCCFTRVSESLKELPDDACMEHSLMAFQIPGVGEGGLAGWGVKATNLSEQSLCRRMFQAGQFADQRDASAQTNQINRIEDTKRPFDEVGTK